MHVRCACGTGHKLERQDDPRLLPGDEAQIHRQQQGQVAQLEGGEGRGDVCAAVQGGRVQEEGGGRGCWHKAAKMDETA